MLFFHHFLGIPVPNIVIALSLIMTKPVSLIIDFSGLRNHHFNGPFPSHPFRLVKL